MVKNILNKSGEAMWNTHIHYILSVIVCFL